MQVYCSDSLRSGPARVDSRAPALLSSGLMLCVRLSEARGGSSPVFGIQRFDRVRRVRWNGALVAMLIPAPPWWWRERRDGEEVFRDVQEKQREGGSEVATPSDVALDAHLFPQTRDVARQHLVGVSLKARPRVRGWQRWSTPFSANRRAKNRDGRRKTKAGVLNQYGTRCTR